MPVSDISWNLDTRPPLFQGHGTKRKLTTQDTTEHKYLVSPKKQCLFPMQPDPECNEMEINHNTGSVLNQNTTQSSTQNQCHMQVNTHSANQQFSHQIQPLPDCQTLPCDSMQSSSNNNNIGHSSLEPSDPNMQLHNDSGCTANASQLGEISQYERSCNSMDSDCSPDPHQYKISFCDQYCAGGDQSPTSGRVRCYCKPSWEGLMEMRPYVSDYY